MQHSGLHRSIDWLIDGIGCRFHDGSWRTESWMIFFRIENIQLRSSYFLARTQRHCSTMAHFPHEWATGRNGWNGLTGWMLLHRQRCVSLPHSKLFSMLKNRKIRFFRLAQPVWHKKVLSCFRTWLIDCGYENGKVLFLCHTGRKQTKTKYFSIFQHAENLWMRKWTALVFV